MRLLSTSTFLDNHVIVTFQHDLLTVVQVKEWQFAEFGGNATRLGHDQRINGADQRLQHRMVGRVQVVGQREPALTVTVIHVIALWSHDPITEPDVIEFHVQLMPLADLFWFSVALRRRFCRGFVSRPYAQFPPPTLKMLLHYRLCWQFFFTWNNVRRYKILDFMY